MSEDARIVLVTAPTIEEAAQLGRRLVEEQLAACVNLVPGIRSIYRWQGRVQDDAEVLMIIKTTAAACDQLTHRVLELHSYATPEVLALPVLGGAGTYLEWLRQQVRPEG